MELANPIKEHQNPLIKGQPLYFCLHWSKPTDLGEKELRAEPGTVQAPILACRDGSMCGKWQGWHESVYGTGLPQHPAVWETEAWRKLINLLIPGCYGMWICGFQKGDNERRTDTEVLGKPTAPSFDPQSLQALPGILVFQHAVKLWLLFAWMRNWGTLKSICLLALSMKEVLTSLPNKTRDPQEVLCWYLVFWLKRGRHLCTCTWSWKKN